MSPAVVVAAFGVFDAAMITDGLLAARSVASHQAVLSSREAGAASGLAAATASIDSATIESLGRRLTEALSTLDGAARPLFSGLRGLPTPVDPYAKLWRATEMAREHRGDGHLAACVAAGLDGVEMNILTELWLDYGFGEYSTTRGFSADRLAEGAAGLNERGWLTYGHELTVAGRRARENIEQATDASQQALIDALGADLEGVIASAGTVGAAVLASQAAPADARKRAAG